MHDADAPRTPPRRGASRVVVNLVGEPVHGLLAESRFVQRPFLPGGEQNMYELAFALAAASHGVELRGWLDSEAFTRMAQAVGAAPATGLPPRPPTAEDVVVVPEGWQNPLEYAQLLLSPARVAIFLLAPPGLFGWPFSGPGWSRPDPLTVPLDAVAMPAHFVAMHRLGFSLLTHSPGIVTAAGEAGVSCAFVGTGRPTPGLPRPASERAVDAAALMANRWAPLVREVVAQLDGLAVDLIEEAPNDDVLARLAKARTLLWPSRIEGHATIPWEARAVGCVPVALSTNRFAVGLSEAQGAVIVDRTDELAGATRDLLADREHWSTLSERAILAAREEVDWDAYVGRVALWRESLSPRGPDHDARGGMGAALHQWLETESAERQSALEELEAERQRLSQDRDRWHAAHAELEQEHERVRLDRDRMHEERAHLDDTLQALYRKPEVRIALRVDSLRPRRGS
jgi:hypothetical protein